MLTLDDWELKVGHIRVSELVGSKDEAPLTHHVSRSVVLSEVFIDGEGHRILVQLVVSRGDNVIGHLFKVFHRGPSGRRRRA